MKKCPIQIIEDDASRRWITLGKDIDYERGRYNNINEFSHSAPIYFPNTFFYRLFHGINTSYIDKYDIIRNPTMKELIEIGDAAKSIGIKINLKTGEYIGKILNPRECL